MNRAPYFLDLNRDLDMPITGIPFVLENMIDAVFKSHDIRTWSIFKEDNGDISFRLKFNSKGNGQDTVQNISYRRKPPTQVNRDRQRAAKRPRQVSPGISNSTPNPEIETIRAVNESDCASVMQEEFNLDASLQTVEDNLSSNDSTIVHGQKVTSLSNINELDSFGENSELFCDLVESPCVKELDLFDKHSEDSEDSYTMPSVEEALEIWNYDFEVRNNPILQRILKEKNLLPGSDLT